MWSLALVFSCSWFSEFSSESDETSSLWICEISAFSTLTHDRVSWHDRVICALCLHPFTCSLTIYCFTVAVFCDFFLAFSWDSDVSVDIKQLYLNNRSGGTFQMFSLSPPLLGALRFNRLSTELKMEWNTKYKNVQNNPRENRKNTRKKQ